MRNLKKRTLSLFLAASLMIPSVGCRAAGKKDVFVEVEGKKLFDGTTYIDSYMQDGIKHQMAYSNDDIRKYLDLKNPTYDDVRSAIRNNANLSEDFKLAILEYTDLSERKNPDADLVVFCYNMSKLKIEFISSKEMQENIGNDSKSREVVAYFDDVSGTIYLPYGFDLKKEEDRNDFYHELTHAKDTAFLELGNCFVHRINCLIIVDGKKLVAIGQALVEGVTEDYTFELGNDDFIAYKKYGFLTVGVNGYYDYIDIFSLLANCTDYSIEDFHSGGILTFVESMHRNGIDEPLAILKKMDDNLYGNQYDGNDNFGRIRKEIYLDFFEDKVGDWVSEGNDDETIKSMVDNYFDNSFIETQLKNGDEIIDLMYGNNSVELRTEVDKMVNRILENPTNSEVPVPTSSPELPNSVTVGYEDIFVYEDLNHNITWCYRLIFDGVPIYFNNNGIMIDESIIIAGEYISVLEEKGIAELKISNGSYVVSIDRNKWNNFFDESFQMIIHAK